MAPPRAGAVNTLSHGPVNGRGESPDAPAKRYARAVHLPAIAPVEARTTADPVTFEATLQPSDERDLRVSLSVAAYSFVLESYAVARGARVRKGDLVARFVSPHGAVRVAHERSMMHLLEAQLVDARRAAMRGNDPTADLGVTAATQRLEQSRATLEAQRAVAAGIELRSPIDGVITELPTIPAPGGATALVARILATDPLRIEAPVALGDRLPPPGTALEGTVGAMRWRGVVRGLAPLVGADGSATLLIDVANPDGALPAGVRARGEIDVGARTGCFIPASALLREGDRYVAWTLGAAGFVARTVWPVSRAGASTVEVRGLREGERVLRDALDHRAAGPQSLAPLDEP